MGYLIQTISLFPLHLQLNIVDFALIRLETKFLNRLRIQAVTDYFQASPSARGYVSNVTGHLELPSLVRLVQV